MELSTFLSEVNNCPIIQRILFIGHEASLTGAPIYLINLIEWLRKEKSIEADVLLGFDGELSEKYENLGHVSIWNKTIRSKSFWLNVIYFKIWKFLFSAYHQKEILNHLSKKKFDLIVSNTALNGIILEKLYGFEIPVLMVVHEMTSVLTKSNKHKSVDKSIQYSDRIVAVSKSVQKSIMRLYPQIKTNISIVYGMTKKIDFKSFEKRSALLRSEFGIADQDFVIGGIGNIDSRKGIDLFLRLANRLKSFNLSNSLKFLWVGGSYDMLIKSKFLKASDLSDILEHIIFVERTNEPFPYYNMFDLFAMCSREDPFPLVNLEVGQLGIPIVAFKDTGGSQELLEMAGLPCADYEDVEQMAVQIRDYVYDNTRYATAGKAMAKLINNNFLPDKNFIKIFDEIVETSELGKVNLSG